jgi:hypothetical protein
MPPAWCVSGRFPVQEPLILAEIKERKLWGSEDGLSYVWMMNGLNMSAILVQLHVIPGKGDGLMFHLERAFIDPYVDRLVRQPSLAIQTSIVKADVSMPVQVAGVARREENPVEHGFRIHRALVPREDLGGTMCYYSHSLAAPGSKALPQVQFGS